MKHARSNGRTNVSSQSAFRAHDRGRGWIDRRWLAVLFALFLAAPVAAQTRVGKRAPVRVSGPCATPAAWVPKLVSPAFDADQNYVDDGIDGLPPNDEIDVLLALNACPTAGELAGFVAQSGTVAYRSPFTSVVLVQGIRAADAVALGQNPRVALVFFDRPLAYALDVSAAAIKATHSATFDGRNLEDALPSLTGQGVNIAVIDSGIDFGHESLPFTKLVGGLDFSSTPTDPQVQDPDDTTGHGTHVAGIAAGLGGASGPRGIAPGAGLIDVGLGSSFVMSTVERAIDECIDRKDAWNIRIIVLSVAGSFDSDGTDPLSAAVNRAVDAGIVVVTAMGNDGTQLVPPPAAADGAIAVASVDDGATVDRGDDALAPSSNAGPRLDDGDADAQDERKPSCAAPGTSILAPEHDSTTGYVTSSGTSMAAAHVAGLAALLLEHDPGLTPAEVRTLVLFGCERLAGASAGWDPGEGHGEIDAYRSVLLALENLGLPGSGGAFGEGLLALRVREGAVDLNGDGDTADAVLHVHDLAAGTTVNVGLVDAGSTAIGAGHVVFIVREREQGATDLNGDGDTNDLVLHSYDVARGVTSNVGVYADLDGFVGGIAALNVVELGSGATDFNGDGDAQDRVLHLYDPQSGVLTNLGLAVELGTARSDGPLLAWTTREASQGGADLNADGDSGDDVLFVHDVLTGVTTNLGLALNHSTRNLAVAAGKVAFDVSELRQGGVDLNGDGDALDAVPHVYDAALGTVANLGIARVDGEGRQWFDGELLGWQVPEAGQGGTDLNGDGDATDYVVHVRDLSLGTTTNLALASIGYAGDPLIEDGAVVFQVSESSQGSVDLNGDGDAQDAVLHAYDTATRVLTNIGLASGEADPEGILIGEGRVVFRVSELLQGNTDRNGDGDTLDWIAHAYHIASRTIVDYRIPTAAGVSLHYLLVTEGEHGGADLNGDGDADDHVLFRSRWDLGTAVNLRLAAFPRIAEQVGPRALLEASEMQQGHTDLDGDGEANDTVFFLADR